MSAETAATGLRPVPPPRAPDPLRAALARSTAAKAPDRYKLRVRVFGFAAGSPALDDGGDPAVTLFGAVAARDAAVAAETRAPSLKAQRAAKIKARLWPAGS